MGENEVVKNRPRDWAKIQWTKLIKYFVTTASCNDVKARGNI
jgi:hypothetical protein